MSELSKIILDLGSDLDVDEAKIQIDRLVKNESDLNDQIFNQDALDALISLSMANVSVKSALQKILKHVASLNGNLAKASYITARRGR